jgi:Disulphide bond corrector protein DsbC
MRLIAPFSTSLAASVAASFAALAGYFCLGAQLLLAQVPIKDPPLPIPGSSGQSRQNPVQFLAPAQVTIAAGRPALVDLHFRVAGGLHINSHAPHQKTLIPTRLAVVEEEGFKVTNVDFPAGAEYALAFSPKEKLSVYTGDFTLRAHLTARAGEHLLAGELHYQACDVNSCMPPQSLPIEVGILAK